MSVAPKDSVSIEAGALTQKARAGKLNPITKNNIHQFYYNVFVFMYLNTKKKQFNSIFSYIGQNFLQNFTTKLVFFMQIAQSVVLKHKNI